MEKIPTVEEQVNDCIIEKTSKAIPELQIFKFENTDKYHWVYRCSESDDYFESPVEAILDFTRKLIDKIEPKITEEEAIEWLRSGNNIEQCWDDSLCDINLTKLAENLAHAMDKDHWLDDGDHWIWDLVEQEADAYTETLE